MEQTSETVTVRRVITVEYEVPMSSYPGMSKSEIEDWERTGNDDIGMMLNDIKSEEVSFTWA